MRNNNLTARLEPARFWRPRRPAPRRPRSGHLSGGTYPVFSADILLKHQFGISGELAWRASRNLYGGFGPERPLFYDFNGIYAPKLGKPAQAELRVALGLRASVSIRDLLPAAPSVAPIS